MNIKETLSGIKTYIDKIKSKLSTTDLVVPAAYKDLDERIKSLENILLSGSSRAGDLKADSLDGNEITRFGKSIVLYGSGAPTIIPDFIGQFYVNTSGPALYYANGTDSTSNWKQA